MWKGKNLDQMQILIEYIISSYYGSHYNFHDYFSPWDRNNEFKLAKIIQNLIFTVNYGIYVSYSI